MNNNFNNNVYTNKNNFYNLEQIKAIPIEDVCRKLGIDVKHKGSRIMVKIRNERTASTVLNPDRNTFYDFGSQEHGDAIDLVALMNNTDRKNAIEQLANMFNIEPINPRKGLDNNELTLWEYAQIGVYGDMVSKNLNFNPEYSSAQLFEIADKFSMSVNELRRSKIDHYKDIYEISIIQNKALPFIQELRNTYFLSIWEQYSFLKDINALELFDIVCSKPEFEEMYEEIIAAEKIFNRAVKGTNIIEFPKRDYSPNKIYKDILGKTKIPELGPYNYDQMNNLSEKEGSSLKYRPVEYADFMEKQLTGIPYSAFLNTETQMVVIRYLEKDKNEINKLFGAPDIKKKGFKNLVNDAAKRKNEAVQSSSSELKVK